MKRIKKEYSVVIWNYEDDWADIKMLALSIQDARAFARSLKRTMRNMGIIPAGCKTKVSKSE